MAFTTVWGVDIGSSAIKAVKMVRQGQDCCIVDFDVVDIPGSATDEDADRSTRIESALASLTQERNFGRDPVFLGLPGKLCLFREFHLPAGSEGKLDDLVRYEARQQIPFPLDQVEWGYEQFKDDQGLGVEMVAVRKSVLQETLALAEKFKWNVRGVTGSPMALYNYAHYEFQPTETTLVLDAGFHGTDFVVMNNRQVYFRTIQIAGRELTRVLEEKFKVPFEKGEELKKNINTLAEQQREKMLRVILPTLRQLGAEIQRTIGFYRSKSKGRKIAKVYLVGHTFRLPGMVESLNEQIREAPFTVVEGAQRLRVDKNINQGVFINEFPTLAVALGLSLQGLGLGELKLDLLPKAQETKNLLDAKRGWAAACVALLALTFGLALWADNKKMKTSMEAQTAVEKVKSSADAAKRDLKSKEEGLAEKANRLETLSRPFRDRGRIVRLVSEFLALKDEQGNTFFSPKTKTALTNIYVSRLPFDTGDTALLQTTESSRSRKRLLERSVALGRRAPGDAAKTADNIFSHLAGAEALKNIPPELEPDLPMMIVLSGEWERESADMEPLKRLMELKQVLEKRTDIPFRSAEKTAKEKSLWTEDYKTDDVVYKELAPKYSHEGDAPTPPESGMETAEAKPRNLPPHVEKEVERKVLSFNVVLRWEDSNQRDLTVQRARELISGDANTR